MTERTFTCSVCEGTYFKGRSDAGALANLEVEFPGFEPEECDLVCTECFDLITVEARQTQAH